MQNLEMDDAVSQSVNRYCSAPTLCTVCFYLLLPCGVSIFRESGIPSEGRSLRLSPKTLPVCSLKRLKKAKTVGRGRREVLGGGDEGR